MKKNRLFDLGKMRHRIRAYTPTRQDDGSGGFDRQDPSAGTLIGTYWSYIRPVSSRERQWGEQFTERTSHVCWLRYNTSLTEGMIIQRDVGGTTINYYVECLYDPDNLQEFHMLMLREGGPL